MIALEGEERNGTEKKRRHREEIWLRGGPCLPVDLK
jgi:hypothetical protein